MFCIGKKKPPGSGKGQPSQAPIVESKNKNKSPEKATHSTSMTAGGP